MLPLPLIVAIAMVPGLVAWWTGRKLLRLRDDPALPELVFARSQQLIKITAVVVVVAIFFGSGHSLWLMLVPWYALLIGGFSLRRMLFGERIGLPSLVLWTTLSVTGAIGFWMLLAWTPTIIVRIPERYRWIGLALFLILVLWEHFWGRIWLWMHNGKALVSDAVAPRVAAIVERAGIPAPRLYVIGAPGARFVNAVALPATREPAIALGNALMQLLEPDEIAAIYAHELAHIEHYSPRKIRRLQALNRLMILLAVGLPLLFLNIEPWLATLTSWIFPVAVLFELLRRIQNRQKHETESDLRAAALTGDPDAVARALMKVHVHGMIPRRWSVDFERSATHPSLARRIQALRGEGTAAAASPSAPTILTTGRPSRIVVFDDARAYWFDGVPDGTTHDLESLRAQASGMRSVSWPDLEELRVAIDGDDRTLKARHRNGDTWSVPLAPAQVADVQRALDVVDVRLRRELGKKPSGNVRFIAALALLALIMSGSFGFVALPAAFALIWPSTAALAAVGGIALSEAVLKVLTGETPLGFPSTTVTLAYVLAVGIAAVVVAWRRAGRDGKRDGLRLTLLAVGGLAAVMILGVAAALAQVSFRDVGDYSVLRTIAAMLFGLAAAVMVTAAPRWRLSAAGLSLGGLAVAALTLSTGSILTRSDFATRTASATEVHRVNLGDAHAMSLRLSPSGSHFIVERDRRFDSRRNRYGRHVVGLASGARREIDAVNAEFLDDERLLVLRAAGDSLELRAERADSGTVLWKTKVRWVDEPTLAVSVRDRSWTMTGRVLEHDSLVVLSGTVEAPRIQTRLLASGDSADVRQPMVLTLGTRVMVPVFDFNRFVPLPMRYFAGGRMPVNLYELTANGRRHVAEMDGYPQCGEPSESRVVCLTVGGRRQSVWLLEPDGTARLAGSLQRRDLGISAVGPGTRLTFSGDGSRIHVVDAAARSMVRVDLANDGSYVSEARMMADRLGVVRRDSTASSVVIYRVQ